MKVHSIRCCGCETPLGVDRDPVITWLLEGAKQTAWRVQLAKESQAVLDTGWQNGSDTFAHLPFPLEGCTRYDVTVCCRSDNRQTLRATSYFETGLFTEQRKAGFVTTPECEAPLFRKTFTANSSAGGRAYFCGLGYGVLFLNGRPVSDDLLTPVWSDYHKRELSGMLYPIQDEFSHSIYYRTYDITPYLKEGENVVCVLLGNGFYNQHERNVEGHLAYGLPKFFLQLQYADQNGWHTLCSDEGFVYKPSPIVFNNVFLGEQYDARLEEDVHSPAYHGKGWQAALPCPTPKAAFRSQLCPPDRAVERFCPQLLGTVKGRKVYDLGQNLSGLVTLTTSAPAGQAITLRFAEELHEDGSLDFTSTGPGEAMQIQKDVYISNGKKGQRYTPYFTFHGFRYFDVEGEHDAVEGVCIHADVKKTGFFECSDEVLNFIVSGFEWALTSNLHGGVPSDCPHRERLGYTGDGQVSAEAAMCLFDMEAFYRKWLQDIWDCQCHKTGHVQHTAPFYGGGGGPGGWGCSAVLLPWRLYWQTGNPRVLEESFDSMKRWLIYLKNHCENHLVVREEEGGWCLGDWGLLHNDVRIPESYVNSCFYLICLTILERVCALLKRGFPAELSGEPKAVKEAILQTFLQPDGSFANGEQGANAFALTANIADDRAFENLLSHYQALGRLDTGIFATPFLLESLGQRGQAELGVQMLQSRAFGTYGYMMEQGATTLWEWPDGADSHNHHMMGSPVAFLFRYVLGIRAQQPGYSSVIIEPCFTSRLNFAKGSILTPRGTIGVEWQRKGGHIYCMVQVPHNCQAVYRANGREKLLQGGITHLIEPCANQVRESSLSSTQ